MDYKDMLDRVSQIIKDSENQNWIIIGDNSCGKSELLKELVRKQKENVYYIDSVNRYMNVGNINVSEQTVYYDVTVEEIIDWRIRTENFNYKDSFGEQEHIERLYPEYVESLCGIMKDFLGIELKIEKENVDKFGDSIVNAYINGEKMELSSGYQALIRIFAEILFYSEISKKEGTIIIDEIDEFLSPRNSAKILMYLTERFPKHRFIVSTHSGDLICHSKDCKMAILQENEFQVLDSNDFDTMTDVNALFQKIFVEDGQENNDEIEKKLERLLELKLSHCFGQQEEMELEAIKEEELSIVQKVMYNQIRSWK